MKNGTVALCVLVLTGSLIAVASYGTELAGTPHSDHASHQVIKVTQKNTTKSSWAGFGIKVIREKDGIITVDGKPAALDEWNKDAQVYSQGLNTLIFYKTGRVVLMRNGQFVGDLR
ncbi:hypothetical protein H4F52_10720 [Pectobacterium brasiliense]|uniref:hypothetical protein n=1 Tax=Pectobacterium brasiliense TaxID=180957 RepID=UPI001968D7FA|nr:hypothetical protein [Pectobacterium brasiliense]MBN3132209.1 hypothetical protein [Pectobacterium brasiliense]